MVFQGNRVKDQNWDVALFQDLGSNPATMEAARAADFFGASDSYATEVADAEQSYIQADLKGPPTWVCLPRDPWPKSWEGKGFIRPVCRLCKALYGHPDYGSYWEDHCDKHVRSEGVEPIGEHWPSCDFHPALKLYLIIYVDDLKMSGPARHLSKGWSKLRNGLIV